MKQSPPEPVEIRQEIVEVVKYTPLPIPEIKLTPIDKVKMVDGKLRVLTPARMKTLYDAAIRNEEPLVIWTADEAYVRELETWLRANTRYTLQREAQIDYLRTLIDTLRKQSENAVVPPDDP